MPVMDATFGTFADGGDLEFDDIVVGLRDGVNTRFSYQGAPGVYLPLAGGTMAGAIDMDGNSITGLPLPSFASDAATKAYVDSLTAPVGAVGTFQRSTGSAWVASTATIPDTYALGDLIYASAANVLTALSGNITAVKQYLSQTGTGSASQAPAWATISGGDITGAALTKTDDTNVTLSLGGTPTTALLRAASLTLGWTGQLAVSRGGSGAATLTGLLTGNGTSAFTATAITQYNVLTGGASNAPNSVAPSATSGVPLISQGAAAQPIFGTAVVDGGGTGNTTFTAYSLICAGTTATGAFQNVSGLGSANQVLVSNGAAALPSWQSVPGLSPAALTKTDDTNVTLSLGGTPATSLLQAVSLTLGWTGQLSLSRGGSNANLTAVNGGIVYSTASAMAISAAGSSGQLLQSAGAATPVWTTATYPNTTTANQLLYSSANNVITGLASANNSVLGTNGSGVPSLSTTLPSGLTIPGYAHSGANSDITSLIGLTGVIQAPTFVNDVNSNHVIQFTSTAAATDWVSIANGIANGAYISAASSNASANLAFYSKGAAGVVIVGNPDAAVTVPQKWLLGTNLVSISFPTLTSSRSITFPDANVTISGAFSTAADFATIGTFSSGGNFSTASTFSIPGAFSFSGAHSFVGTLTADTNLTFPTSGTLATTSQIPTGAALTKTDDTNVTLTLGGSPTTALVNAASITLGWTGQLSPARGGTGISSLGTGVATALGVNVGSAGAFITFNGNAGTPSALVGTNITGTASGLTAGTASAVAVGGITGLGTGVATALAVNTGSAGAFITFNGNAGTPSALVGTNITGTAAGLTAGSASAVAVGGITGLGTGVATALATNVGSAGAFTTNGGALGTPSSGTLTSCTGLPLTGLATTVSSGTYTPTLFNTTNVSASTAHVCYYMRIGSVVTVAGEVVMTPTSTGVDTILGMSLPVASDFSSDDQLSGNAVSEGLSNCVAGAYSNAANDRIAFEWSSIPTGGSRGWRFMVTYLII